MKRQTAAVVSLPRVGQVERKNKASPLTEYEADCLAGRCFPNPGDMRMQQRCREAFRFREVIELFRRFHMPNLSKLTHYECCIRGYFPTLMDVKSGELGRPAVIQWQMQNGQKSKVQANHALQLLRLLYHKARDWDIYEGRNPTDGVKRFTLRSRSRFVQEEEMPRLLEALQHEPEHMQVFFLLSLLVACRPGEARSMKWAHLRFTNELIREQLLDGTYQERAEFAAVWNKPMTKSGVPHSVPLPPELAARLNQLPRSEWVFPGAEYHCRRKAPGPMSYEMIHKHWVRIRNQSGLKDVRPYDLRRTCASWLAINGQNAMVIAKVLCHANLQHTHIYARLNTRPVSEALNAHTDQVLGYAPRRVMETTPAPPPAPEGPIFVPVLPRVTSALIPIQNECSSEEKMEWPG